MGARILLPETGLPEAAERLRRGELVAFPTETVYGLGANALDGDAVAAIFAAKGRPSTNPVIVHVPDTESARQVAGAWTNVAEELARAFWPGPLTLVVPRGPRIPDIVTAGGPTVGIRVPAHHVALDLLRAAGIPLAAPSANRSEEISPTTAQHVADSLGSYLPNLLILDGGPCVVGLESTVLDITGSTPRILRPGMVTEPMLSRWLGEWTPAEDATGIARSPGQMVRHYAPRHPVLLLRTWHQIGEVAEAADVFLAFSALSAPRGEIAEHQFENLPQKAVRGLLLPSDPRNYAAGLYDALRKLDAELPPGRGRILVETPPDSPEWAAIRDRLRRAAA